MKRKRVKRGRTVYQPTPHAARAPGDVLTTEQVAADYNFRAGTLGRWRRDGKGPAFRTIEGKLVRYQRADVEAWLNAQPAGAAPAPTEGP